MGSDVYYSHHYARVQMGIYFTAYLRASRLGYLHAAEATLAEIQSYTITYLIKHYRAQQDGEAGRGVGACVRKSADGGKIKAL